MAMARHWRLSPYRLRSPLSASSVSTTRNVDDRSYCSLDQPSNSQPLTLENLGFVDDDGREVDVELIRAQQGRRHQRQKSGNLPQKPFFRAREPTFEEKKQAALDASYILARVAGMQIRRVKTAGSEGANAKGLSQQQEGEECEDEGLAEAKAKEGVDDDDDERKEQKEGEETKRGEPDGNQGAHEAAQASTLDHPWPEWLEFLRVLQANGFFEGAEKEVDEGKHLFESFAAVKLATNAFGRSHAEIFNCLSRKDLRVLASFGCPDEERKASNASKRLRAHFQIKEGDVCQCCQLKMTCPRAFFAPESKLSMNTLDVVRIIAGYATNVWPNADSCMSYPSEVGTSICNLLREFLTYKVSSRDSAEEEILSTERVPLNSEKNLKKNSKSYPPLVDQKPGDWTCPNCEFVNFGRNRRCRECRVCRPPRQEMKIAYAGDWHCPKCRYLNFSKNSFCRECKSDRPTNFTWTGAERPVGDPTESDKLLTKERKYEASEEEGMSDMALTSPNGSSEQESDATFSDEEERALAKGLSNAARKLTRPSFKWEDMTEGSDSFLHLNVKRKVSRPLKTKSKLRDKVSRMREGV